MEMRIKHSDKSEYEEDKARLTILELSNMMSVPMSLIAVINLKVPEAIWQGGSNIPLSASQILHRIRPHGGGDVDNLQRILRLLTSYDIFEEHLTDTPQSGDGERKYSLTYIGKTLIPDSINGLSYSAYMLQHHQEAFMRAWPLVGEAVEDPKIGAFKKANGGEDVFQYYADREDAINLFHKAFYGMSVPFMTKMLENYDGFQGVETLVDVGGNSGVCLRMIMSKYPTLRKAINYDLPHMVDSAPHIPGVTHIGGDALEYVPCCDAIFMKWIFLDWSDEECKQVMHNCYEALPANGKLIICEPVLPELTDNSQRTRTLFRG
ncbi:Winged helix-like DNA-binding domain superfamily [Sesbania bispinosa]|nr:Winged helix-like DNA-binding domain superfamily [Sesbania bispinosa]